MREIKNIIAEYLRKSKVFAKERIPIEIKVKAYILSMLGWGLRDTVKEFGVSHEAVRRWLIKISHALGQIKMKKI